MIKNLLKLDNLLRCGFRERSECEVERDEMEGRRDHFISTVLTVFVPLRQERREAAGTKNNPMDFFVDIGWIAHKVQPIFADRQKLVQTSQRHDKGNNV